MAERAQIRRPVPPVTAELVGLLDRHDGRRYGSTAAGSPSSNRRPAVEAVRKAFAHLPAERIHLATDCCQFALPRKIPRGKLAAMAAAAEQLRSEIGS